MTNLNCETQVDELQYQINQYKEIEDEYIRQLDQKDSEVRQISEELHQKLLEIERLKREIRNGKDIVRRLVQGRLTGEGVSKSVFE